MDRTPPGSLSVWEMLDLEAGDFKNYLNKMDSKGLHHLARCCDTSGSRSYGMADDHKEPRPATDHNTCIIDEASLAPGSSYFWDNGLLVIEEAAYVPEHLFDYVVLPFGYPLSFPPYIDPFPWLRQHNVVFCSAGPWSEFYVTNESEYRRYRFAIYTVILRFCDPCVFIDVFCPPQYGRMEHSLSMRVLARAYRDGYMACYSKLSLCIFLQARPQRTYMLQQASVDKKIVKCSMHVR